MNLQYFFNETSSKLENGEFVLLKIKEETHPENFHSNTESINFLIYMWCLSNQKFRIPELFDYVLIPKDLPDHDFSDVNFEEFFDFLCSIKIDDDNIADALHLLDFAFKQEMC